MVQQWYSIPSRVDQWQPRRNLAHPNRFPTHNFLNNPLPSTSANYPTANKFLWISSSILICIPSSKVPSLVIESIAKQDMSTLIQNLSLVLTHLSNNHIYRHQPSNLCTNSNILTVMLSTLRKLIRRSQSIGIGSGPLVITNFDWTVLTPPHQISPEMLVHQLNCKLPDTILKCIHCQS